ncbi:MAG: hypothetical protein M3R53_03030 [Candidatus Eremiobacteraeota bacterium]|nr:hypothetical protein [Candidatus Eremiobacteraeota bacterium]
MRRLVRSEGYARARVVSGVLFAVLGAVVFVRSIVAAGVSLPALPGSVLGLAMLALGVLRVRDYAASRRP